MTKKHEEMIPVLMDKETIELIRGQAEAQMAMYSEHQDCPTSQCLYAQAFHHYEKVYIATAAALTEEVRV